jgi:hypothetical protein
VYAKIGRRASPPPAEGELDRLTRAILDCHERIRRFCGLGLALARHTGAPEEARAAAGQIRRYFADSLPRHTSDEDESLMPRLVGRDPALDAALALMAGDHERHEPLRVQLVELCASVEGDSLGLGDRREDLHRLTAAFEGCLLPHLAFEERVVVPAMALLGPDDLRSIGDEMRARRA